MDFSPRRPKINENAPKWPPESVAHTIKSSTDTIKRICAYLGGMWTVDKAKMQTLMGLSGRDSALARRRGQFGAISAFDGGYETDATKNSKIWLDRNDRLHLSFHLKKNADLNGPWLLRKKLLKISDIFKEISYNIIM